MGFNLAFFKWMVYYEIVHSVCCFVKINDLIKAVFITLMIMGCFPAYFLRDAWRVD